MILITGASGNIGRRLTGRMLEAGKKIRVTSRSHEKVADFEKNGAETAIGDLLDPSFCEKAFEGCDRAFLLVQGNSTTGRHYEEEIIASKNYAEQLKTQNIEHAVFISSLGVEEGTASPIIDAKIPIEKELKQTGVPVTVIRPGNFLENMYSFLETISSAGFFTHPMAGDIKIPQVSVEDIALIAFKVFERGPNGWEIINMPGIECSFFEIARGLSEKLNRMIKYMRVSDEQFREVFTGFGISEKFCDDYLAMFRFFERAHPKYDRATMPPEFNYRPTSLDEFLSEFVKQIK
jgi:uncharacterized protein YbjT (DUF2867 family)